MPIVTDYVHHYDFEVPDSATFGELKTYINSMTLSNQWTEYGMSMKLFTGTSSTLNFHSVDSADVIQFALNNPWQSVADSATALSEIWKHPVEIYVDSAV